MLWYLGNVWLAVVTGGFLVTAWRLGVWRNWQQYYPTLLFVACVDFLTSLLTYEYPLWYFVRTLLIPNHTMIDMFVVLTNFPPIVLLYLSCYPAHVRLPRQLLYLLAWSLGCSLLESGFFLTGMVSYHNGWSFWWSILMWHLMFLMVRLHALRPLWAWLAVAACAIGGILYFHIPVAHLK